MKKLLSLFSLIGCFSLFAMHQDDITRLQSIAACPGEFDQLIWPCESHKRLLEKIKEENERKRIQDEFNRKKNWFEELKKDCKDTAQLELEPGGTKLQVIFSGKHDLKDHQTRQKNSDDINTIMWLLQRYKSASEPVYFKVTDVTFNTELTDPNYFEIIHKSLS